MISNWEQINVSAFQIFKHTSNGKCDHLSPKVSDVQHCVQTLPPHTGLKESFSSLKGKKKKFLGLKVRQNLPGNATE